MAQRGPRTPAEKTADEQAADQERLEQESNAQSAIDAAALAGAEVAAAQAQARDAQDQADARIAVVVEAGTVEEYIVVHPKFNLYLGPDHEQDETYTLIDGGTVPVKAGWILVPSGARLRPADAVQLADFRLKAGLGFLRPIAAEAH